MSTLPSAPYFADVAYGPEDASAHYVRSDDGVRLRAAAWPLKAARGTVLIFSGRTEYIEKYGQTAAALHTRGLACASIDWRGQGLADRLVKNPILGHVERFTDYQRDVAALLDYVRQRALPEPFYLMAHSMGGAVGLRALISGLPVAAAAFTGPMWGISMPAHLRPAAWVLAHVMPGIGKGQKLPPGTQMENHILGDGFEKNMLTRDRRQFDILHAQLSTHPELVVGGPSFVWLREALSETRRLSRAPSPALPCVTFLGSNERIVDVPAVHHRMEAWPNGRLEIIEDGEHEVLMEGPAITGPILDHATEVFFRAA